VIRLNFIRLTSLLTYKFKSKLTIVLYVDIFWLRHLCRQMLTWVLRSTLRRVNVDLNTFLSTYRVINVDINDVIKICQHRAWWSMSTLRPKPFSVDIERDFCVDLLNFDLNNSTPKFDLFKKVSKISVPLFVRLCLSTICRATISYVGWWSDIKLCTWFF